MIQRQHSRSGARGQTTVEYLMLIAAAFITAYIMVSGPLSKFTSGMLGTMRGSLQNVVQNGEMTPGAAIQDGQRGHPSDPTRYKALHL